MEREIYNSLQLREIFHLEFLKWLNRESKVKNYILKGGSNLRFFFNSIRYSEDMDLDVCNIEVEMLKEVVIKILKSSSFGDGLKVFGIDRIVAPDMSKAKQTNTTQRFKVHLLTFSGEDLFTKVEFSRRGIRGDAVVDTVSNSILRSYKSPPILASHYDGYSALIQKIDALATRSMVQARDVFDIYTLSSQLMPGKINKSRLAKVKINKAYQRIFEIGFNQYRDTVVSYLSSDDQALYGNSDLWDEVKLKVASFIEELKAA